MVPADLDPKAPGTLVEIEGGWAFLPVPLPVEFPLSIAVLHAVSAAERALGSLVGYASSVQNDFLVQRPLMTREAVKSARIEGTYVIISEVLKQQAAGPPENRQAALDNLEVIRYVEALGQGLEWLKGGAHFGPHLVRGLHETLLADTRGADKKPGEYRKSQVLIGSPGDTPQTARFVPPPPIQVPSLMENLIAFMGNPDPWPPLVAAALSHYQFETIHPFEDGNGRMGRLLIPLLLIAHGVIDQPLVYLSDYLDANRDRYFDCLKAVSFRGTWEQWILFYLEAVRVTAVDAVTRIKTIVALKKEYTERVLDHSRSQTPLAALDLVLEKVIVTVADVEVATHCSNPTARAALNTLADLNVLRAEPQSYPARWVAEELIRVAYDL